MAVGNENIVIGSGHPIDWSRFSQVSSFSSRSTFALCSEPSLSLFTQMMGRSEGVELQERGQTADVIKMFGRLINAYTAFKVTNDIANSQNN